MKEPIYYRRFDYDKALIPNKYLASLEEGVSTIEQANEKTGLTIGYPGWNLVYDMVISHLHHEEYNIIIETGTNIGCTTIILAQALKDSGSNGKVYTVELDKKNYQNALTNLEKSGVSGFVEAFNAHSHDFLKDFVKTNSSVRVAFLDASHLFDDVIGEFELILPLLGPQSIVIFDNTYLIAEENEDQRVNGALKEIIKRHGGNLINFETVSWYTPGLAVWQKSPFDDSALQSNKIKITSEVQTQNKDRIVEMFSQAHNLAIGGDYSQALELYDKIIADMPALVARTPQINYERALCLKALGRIPEAEQAIRSCLSVKPDNPEYLQFLSGILFVTGSDISQSRKSVINTEPANIKQPEETDRLYAQVKMLLPLVEQADTRQALKAISLIEERITGRWCGDLGDKLLQYLSIVHAARATGRKHLNSIEIGTLFGGSCLAKLFAMRDLGIQGRIVCIDPMTGYYGQQLDPKAGLPVTAEVFFRNIDNFGFSREAIDLREVKSSDTKAIERLEEKSFATLLIDGDHSYQGVREDWENYCNLVMDRGIVLFDDYSNRRWPDIGIFVNELKASLPRGWHELGCLGTTLLLERTTEADKIGEDCVNKEKIYEGLNKCYFSEECHEKEIIEHLPELLNGARIFVDIGASLGQYTLGANRYMRQGEILAIEADPVRFEELERNCHKWQSSSANKLSALLAAVCDKVGQEKFYITNSGKSGALFKRDLGAEPVNWSQTMVECVTLDELFKDTSPDLVKIDVEGAELRVLKGATRILSEGRTRFLIEVHSGVDPEGQKNPAEVFKFMESFGYNHTNFYGRSLFFNKGTIKENTSRHKTENKSINTKEHQNNTRATIIDLGLETVSAHSDSDRLNALEVGCMFKTNEGFSTFQIAHFLQQFRGEKRFISVDCDPEHIYTCKRMLGDFDPALLSEVQFLCGDSIEMLPKALNEIQPVEFALLDGGADPECCLREFELVVQSLSENGLVIIDDLHDMAPTQAYPFPRIFGKGTLILPYMIIAEYMKIRDILRFNSSNIPADPAKNSSSAFIAQTSSSELLKLLENLGYLIISKNGHRMMVAGQRFTLESFRCRLAAKRLPSVEIAPTGMFTDMLPKINRNDTLTYKQSLSCNNTIKPTAEAPPAAERSLGLYANKYTGRRAFIIGNGPSLNKMDLTKLKDEITFGVNSIFYNFDKMGFKPTFYVVEDKLVAEDRAGEINALTGMTKIFGTELRYSMEDSQDVVWANVIYDFSNYPGFPHFSQDASQCLWVGGTVSYLCMQLAYYMGFSEVYLVGFDHNYVIPADANVDGTIITSASNDPNHFHPEYFGKGKRWHDPRLDRMEKAYIRAKGVFEAHGSKIFNATVGGRLEIFPRVNYESLFVNDQRNNPANTGYRIDSATTIQCNSKAQQIRNLPANEIITAPKNPRFSHLVLDYTRMCNSRCTYCGIWKMKDGPELSLEAIERTFSSISPFGLSTCYVTGGEPYISDKVVDIARLMHKYLPKCRLSGATNGIQPTKILERLQKILNIGVPVEVHVSINGSEATHDATRGGPGYWKKAVYLLETLKSAGVPVVASMSLMPQTLADLPYMQEFCAQRDIRLMFSWVRQWERYGSVDKQYSTWPENIKTRLKEIEYLPDTFDCPGLSKRLVITPEGNVYPCEVYHPEILLGNVNRESLECMLNSSRTDAMTQMICNKNCHWCQGKGEYEGSPKWMLMDCYRRHSNQYASMTDNFPQAVNMSPQESRRIIQNILSNKSVHQIPASFEDKNTQTDFNSKGKARISAIICTYRNPEMLRSTIESLLNQTLRRDLFEIIVVDNNSQDRTRQVVQSYDGVRYVHAEKLGLSHARNAGIEVAEGEIIAFIDDDAEASPFWLEALLKVYDRVPETWAAGGKVLPIWDAEKPQWLTEKFLPYLSLIEWGDNERALSWPERIIGTNCSFRREVFDAVGLFDTSLGRIGTALIGSEDIEIQKLIHSSGRLVYYVPDAVVHHHVPAQRMTKEYLEKRHFGGLQSQAIIALQMLGKKAQADELATAIRNAESTPDGTAMNSPDWQRLHLEGINALRCQDKKIQADELARLISCYEKNAPQQKMIHGRQVRVSVVVCTHRNARMLAMTLESLARQTLDKALYEVIVVDNNSGDSTKEVVERYPEARYVLEEKLGLSHARNTGVQAARSDIIAFIDDDAEASEYWLEALLKIYETVPDAWAAGGKVLPIWDAPKPDWITEDKFRQLSLVGWGDVPRPLHWPERIIGTNCSFRRQVFNDIGFFDTGLGRIGTVLLGNEDTEIQQRIHSLGHSVYYTPDAVVYHHVPAYRMTREYFKRRSEGTIFSQNIMSLRSQGKDQEIEKINEELRRTLEQSDLVQKQQYALNASNERLLQYKDKHRGQRCVIIGNGPSLNKMDLSFLKNEFTFGMNRIYLLFDKWNFRPTYFVSVNPLVMEQSAEEIRKIAAPKFLALEGLPFIGMAEENIFIQRRPGGAHFSDDPRNGCWWPTVTYAAMQLAYFMGFSEVILIGVDHYFKTQGDANKEIVSDGVDENHFHPDYFGKGIRWNLPDLERSEVAYRLAKQAFEADGRRIIDATVDGHLTIFPKADYRQIFDCRSPVPNRKSQIENRKSPEYLVSAIVSTYNSERFLRGCLDDLERQTIADSLEIIVVNSGSKENEEAIVREYQQKYNNIVYIKTEQREGIYTAWNRAVRAAKGTYLTNANTDDRHRKDALEIMAKTLQENPDAALVYGDQICTDTANGTFENHHATEMASRPQYSRERLIFGNCVGSQPMWRRSLHNELGYFDETLTCAGDWDFWLRISNKYRFRHIPEYLGLYYYNESGIEHGSKIHSLYERYIVGKRYGNPYISVIPQYKTYDNPLVSVIMPAYNASEYIAEAIESVLIQNYRNFELVIINDGSTDNTEEIADAFRDEKIRYFKQENRGLAATHNTGIRQSRGEFIIKLDADDKMMPEFIAGHIREFDKHPEADLVYCDDCLIDENDKPIRIIRRQEYTDRKLLIRDMFRSGFPVVPFRTCIRRSVFDKIGFFDESLRIGEDYDMMRRFVKHGLKIQHLPDALYLRRMTENSLSRSLTPEKAKCYFDLVRRFGETFRYDELFPGVEWDEIPPDQRQLHAKCLAVVTYLAIGQDFVNSHSARFFAYVAFERACSELRDCLKIDPNNSQIQALLQKCELGRRTYQQPTQQTVR